MAKQLTCQIVSDSDPERLAAEVNKLLRGGCEPSGGLAVLSDQLFQAVVFKGSAAALSKRVRKTSVDD